MAGRPKARIDWGFVGNMLEADCTATGIAAMIGISVDTLYVRCKTDNKIDFSAFSQQKRAKGDDLLRAKQFKVAMEGNPTMLIWLGKNRLGQADKTEITGADGGPIQTQTVFDHSATVATIAARSGGNRGESGED